ncbi:hypothetical protein HPP92_023518 [Vanilla planifolia]|uniref:Uncharacterized protein n=1 Tax=Vanilla planifolia TaxID=51239 RepID=A0A835PNL7_VANPL|nr:hypothetical protein HPP92_023793 [Vanilla planifolia]KAG0455730.1 hypothetical protein HPP92_023518 [Vanilla planifolia]
MEDTCFIDFSPSSECGYHWQGFQQSVWGDYFIKYSSMSSSDLELIVLRIRELKYVLSQALRDTTDILRSLELIDNIQHLGVAYHFQIEINEALTTIHDVGIEHTNDLHTIALGFRLLREQRLPISADVFNSFLDKEGEFKASLIANVKALLSLYEAACLGTPNEEILEKAIDFTRRHLSLMCSHLEPNMGTMVARALRTPRFRRMERLEAREFISLYEKQENRREDLLQFAKLDFQWVQSIHLEELRSISIWYKNISLAKHLPFARDRLVELYFWIVGVCFKPCFSYARIWTTKLSVLVSMMDDIYDQYGTLEELQLFTDIIKRWEFKEGFEKLSIYLQKYILVLYRTFKELENELELKKNTYRIQYLKEEVKKLSQAYLEEKQWGIQGYVPNVNDHLKVSLISCAYPLLVFCFYVGMEETIPEEIFHWVASFPKIVRAMCIICRIMNDNTSDEHEQKENHVATTMHSYMKEHKCTKEEASQKLMEMVENAWKTLNQEFLLLTDIPVSLLRPIINLSCMVELIYKDKDSYTNPHDTMTDNIKLVMLEPFSPTKII